MEEDKIFTFFCLKISSLKAERLIYCVSFLLISTFALILKSFASTSLLNPLQSLSCSDSCIKQICVYRLSLASVTFHAFFCLYTGLAEKYDLSQNFISFKYTWWIKTALLLILCISFFFIPHTFFYSYPIAAMVFSVFYLILQMFILVNFTHNIAEKCVENYEMTYSVFWKILLIGITVTLFSLVLCILIAIYVFYHECWINPFVISFLFFFNAIQVFASVHPKIQSHFPSSGLLQSSVVALYSMYLMATAIHSDSLLCFSSSSAVSSNGDAWTDAIRIISMIVSIFSLVYSALDTATGIHHEKYHQSYFHFVFMMASFYMAIAFTDWNFDFSKEKYALMNAPHLPYWTKLASFLDSKKSRILLKGIIEAFVSSHFS
ncbi:Membrane protein tms1 [Coelomomyces lativittatus]|nr:Membrane protein tms1 [Coelomomyces lativittatus]KAJ1514307.1 Membrane protein tms1 [Coelomomyces lativittatus]KAJ1514493.1 Membrane protein tms1 [Coelomomyces lativittatus]